MSTEERKDIPLEEFWHRMKPNSNEPGSETRGRQETRLLLSPGSQAGIPVLKRLPEFSIKTLTKCSIALEELLRGTQFSIGGKKKRLRRKD